MHRLLTLPETPVAYELVRRLNEAGIDAEITTERSAAALYVGSTSDAIIWIRNEADRDRAIKMYDTLHSEQVNLKCPECGYNLEGHAGAVNCPECGRSTTALIEDVICPECGETVPGNFEVCWNCGTSITN